MNKTKMMLAGTGGVVVLAVLAMAYFTWNAIAAKTAAMEGSDEEDGLETYLSKAQQLSRKPVYPCGESLAAIESNRAIVVEWQKEATQLATRGDRTYAATTPAAFKTFIVGDAKRLAALPGGVSGVLVKPEFAFGPFKDYIVEGKMPAESQLAELQRRWDDVATITEILAQSGISELTDVQYKTVAEPKEDPKEARRKNRAKNRNAKKAKPSASDRKEPIAHSYVFTFTTKPAGLVKALNAFVVSERFVTVEDFSFARAQDALASALGGDEKKKETPSAGGRRGRRRAAAAQQDAGEKEKDAKGGIVTDPLLDEPFTVVMTATVHDFRTLEEEQGVQK